MRERYFFILTTTLSAFLLLSCSKQYESKSEAPADALMMSEIGVEESDADKSMDYDMVRSGNSKSSSMLQFVPPTIVPDNFMVPSSDTVFKSKGARKLALTANLKFRVRDVTKATYAIEEIALRNNGFVLRSAINNMQASVDKINISKDSTLVVYYNDLTATMSVRVPHEQLYKVLSEIAPLALQIDFRTIEAEDVTTQLLSEQLKAERKQKKQKRVSTAIDNKGRKLDDIVSAEDTLDDALEQKDDAILSAYNLNDRIAFSYISIDLYQDQTTYSETIVRQIDIADKYKPGIGYRIWKALSDGWDAMCDFFIVLISIWPFLIIIAITVYVFVIIRRKRKAVKERSE